MIQVREHEPLAPLTTFNIGGVAEFYTDARTKEDVQAAVAWAGERERPLHIIAGGSNILIADDMIRGLVVRIVGEDSTLTEGRLEADAGRNLFSLITQSAAAGFGGWEKLAGIPGTLGGAVRGNAGAFGTEIKDVFFSAHAYNIYTNEAREFFCEACGFAYRTSFFKQHPEWLIIRVQLTLRPVAVAESTALIEETVAEREKRHIQNIQAAGSYFMNPAAPADIQALFGREKRAVAREGRVPAGWLIEKVDLKGAVVGGAQASAMHPNYLINTGNATARDVLELAQKIKDTVQREFGILLQEEVMVLRNS